MVSAKDLRSKELDIFGEIRTHCGWSHSREIINEAVGHGETGEQ